MPFGSHAFRKNEPLSRHTTFNIGGPAAFWYEAIHQELEAVSDLAVRAGLPVLMLGGGSNCLVSDAGYEGIVVRLSDVSFPTTDTTDGATTVVSACSNMDWDRFVSWCCQNRYQGLECMAGVPGTVGGAVFCASGCYGQNIAEVLEWVDELDLRTGSRRRRYAGDITFGYRFSDYQVHPDTVILAAGFRLNVGAPASHTHPDVASILPFTASLAQVADGVRRIRERKGAMLWLPHRGHNRTAGSFFKNPTVSQQRFDRLSALIDMNDGRPWWWPVADGYRISAARLIELAGFERGHRDGDAAISPEHTLSLVNMGNAKAADIIGLARHIQDGVHAISNVVLQPEVRMIGFERPPLG